MLCNTISDGELYQKSGNKLPAGKVPLYMECSMCHVCNRHKHKHKHVIT